MYGTVLTLENRFFQQPEAGLSAAFVYRWYGRPTVTTIGLLNIFNTSQHRMKTMRVHYDTTPHFNY